MSDRSFARRAEALGHAIFYLVLRLTGQLGAYALLWPVVLAYVLCSRRVHRLTAPYRHRRFPGRGPAGRWQDTFRLIHCFGQVLVDRAWLGIRKKARLQLRITGLDTLHGLLREGRGLVLLTAHVGNWQTALAHLNQLPARINVLMQYEEEAVAKHYFDLRQERCPFAIIRSDGFLGGMVEAAAALQRGELVTIMGDRLTRGPFAEADFLGATARLPVAAYGLAANTGSPVAVLLAAKTSRRRFSLRVWDVFRPAYRDRASRQQELGIWANRFARVLEGYLREFPYQWYNFFDFWQQ